MGGLRYDDQTNSWVLKDHYGHPKFKIGQDSEGIEGFVQVIGTSAALQTGVGTIAISTKEGGNIKFEDVIVANPGTLMPASTGSGPCISWVRATNDGLVNFSVWGSIGVMNWSIVAIKPRHRLASP